MAGKLDRKGSRTKLKEMMHDLPADILGLNWYSSFNLQNLPAEQIIVPQHPRIDAPVVRG